MNDGTAPKKVKTTEETGSRTAEQERYVARNVARMSPANQGDLVRILRRRKLGRMSPGSEANLTLVVRRCDEFLKGRPIRDISADEALSLMEHLAGLPGHKGREPAVKVVHQRSVLFRAYLKELFGVEELPAELDRATYVPKPPDQDVGHAVTQEQFRALLDAAIRMFRGTRAARKAVMAAAIMWTLWDGGLRAGELLSLNVEEVEFKGERAGIIHIREARRGNRLKTGPGDVAVTHAVPALRLWLEEYHPAGNDPNAPLFIGFTSEDGQRGLAYKDLYDMVVKAGERSGVNASLPDGDHISPHDLRHTAAVEKSWMGDAVLRKQFRWSKRSSMPGHYTNHLSADNILGRMTAQADAALPSARAPPKLVPTPAPVVAMPAPVVPPTAVSLEDILMDALLKRLVTKGGVGVPG